MGITNPGEEYFKDGAWGWDGSEWRKLPIVWGYTERWREDLGGTKSGDGDYAQASTAVPAGWIYRVELVSQRNVTAARGRQDILVYDDTSGWRLKVETSPARYVATVALGPFTLMEGDKVGVVHVACLNGDVIQAVAWGYKMKVT